MLPESDKGRKGETGRTVSQGDEGRPEDYGLGAGERGGDGIALIAIRGREDERGTVEQFDRVRDVERPVVRGDGAVAAGADGRAARAKPGIGLDEQHGHIHSLVDPQSCRMVPSLRGQGLSQKARRLS